MPDARGKETCRCPFGLGHECVEGCVPDPILSPLLGDVTVTLRFEEGKTAIDTVWPFYCPPQSRGSSGLHHNNLQ